MSTVLEVQRLGYRYTGGRGISDVSFTAGAGEVVCIFGFNGAGKTTLLKVLSTSVAPQEGSYRVCGCDITRDRETVRRRIFPVFDANAHFEHLTGRENARFFLSLYGVTAKEALDEVAAGFELDLDQVAGKYSLGMKRKLLLAESFTSGKEVLLFDEPTLGLDSAMRQVFFARVRDAAKNGSCVLLGTNRIEDARDADRILLLDKGTMSPAASIDALAAGMIKVIITLDNRTLVEYIPSVDELPPLTRKILALGIPRKIEIETHATSGSMYWTDEAEAKVRRAPQFLQKMIHSLVEQYARDYGYRRITPDLVDEVKTRFERR
jgi:ABC-2 type transport system ATP-binding protein